MPFVTFERRHYIDDLNILTTMDSHISLFPDGVYMYSRRGIEKAEQSSLSLSSLA